MSKSYTRLYCLVLFSCLLVSTLHLHDIEVLNHENNTHIIQPIEQKIGDFFEGHNLHGLDQIPSNASESPIRKYFTTKKIMWTFDDYWMHFNHYPPHQGFGGLSEQINNYGGHVNIMVPFIPPWIGEALGNELRNYSVVEDFSFYHSGFSQNHINLSLDFFNRPLIYPQCHGWNHSANLGFANLSYACQLISYTFWNWHNNFDIKPNFFLGHGSDGNFNISLALKLFSLRNWPVYAENFRTDWDSRFPNGTLPAIEYIGPSCDPYFGCTFGTPCETLEEAQGVFINYSQERELLLIRGHPSFLDDPSHEEHLVLWQQWIDWIYQNHTLLNINHTQAIQYKIDRNNFTVVKNNIDNFTINLTQCLYDHTILFSNPYNDSSQWILKDYQGNIVEMMQNDTYIQLHASQIYYFTRITKSVEISLEHGWNMISLPINSTIEKEDFMITHKSQDYQWDEAVHNETIFPELYYWNTSIAQYDLVNSIKPGNGYWIYANTTCSLWLSSNKSYNTTYSTQITSQWNLIGFSCNTTKDLDNMTIFYNQTYYDWDQAINQSLLLPFIYTWDYEENQYKLVTTVNPNQGYWLYSKYSNLVYF